MNNTPFVKWTLGIVASLVVVGIIGGIGFAQHTSGQLAQIKVKVESNEKAADRAEEVRDKVIRIEGDVAHVKEKVNEVEEDVKQVQKEQQEQRRILERIDRKLDP